jgi:hypothetical protein
MDPGARRCDVDRAGAGGGSLLLSQSARTSTADSSPFPVGQVFTRAEWAKVRGTLVRHGFSPATLHVVSGMRLQAPSRPFGLVRAASASRGVCFFPVRGTRPGTATCSVRGDLGRPLLVFAASDRWGGHTATDVIGAARRSIVGVSMIDQRGFRAGVALIPSGRFWSFAGGYGDSRLVVQARAASGRIAAQVTLP